ncbi:MAG: type II toxin-antitoxin system Phd/YefM family antitoxin [Xenococcaceae cyanobacterium]
MTESFSEEEIKAHLSEAIDLARQEGFITITRHGIPVAAIVKIDKIEPVKSYIAAILDGKMANLAEEWEDADEFARELDKVIRDR